MSGTCVKKDRSLVFQRSIQNPVKHLRWSFLQKCSTILTLWAPTPQNGQTYSNNSSALADELFGCVWLFCKICAWRVNTLTIFAKSSINDVWLFLEYASVFLKEIPPQMGLLMDRLPLGNGFNSSWYFCEH